ncbi:hypothetical protein Pen02_25630 [Plantactinospora endophytica]|uniref:Uncharacterized protein n=1 Tax=Plantactinospora endophytica TaxID=673535 RepID=A0ABQ4DYW7_9ACTN|nr:hypothetical protein Pen02_25630 [Plantactinospora endophytica]
MIRMGRIVMTGTLSVRYPCRVCRRPSGVLAGLDELHTILRFCRESQLVAEPRWCGRRGRAARWRSGGRREDGVLGGGRWAASIARAGFPYDVRYNARGQFGWRSVEAGSPGGAAGR